MRFATVDTSSKRAGWQKRRRVLLLALPLTHLGGRGAADFRVTATARRVLNYNGPPPPFCFSAGFPS